MTTKTKKGLIFDVDGTLIKTDMSYPKEIVERVMEETGDGVYNEGMVPYFWFGGDGIGRGEILKKEFGVSDLEKFWSSWTDYLKDFDYSMKFKSIYHDVTDAIKLLNLRGLSLAIVTDAPLIYAGPQIDRFLPKEFFNPILTLSDTPGLRSKPDPSGLLLCVDKMGLPLNEVSYIGDATNDLYAAAGAGMDFIWIDRGEHPLYAQPKEKIKSLYEFLK